MGEGAREWREFGAAEEEGVSDNKFKVSVERSHPAAEGERYGSNETIYEQRVPELDLWGVIQAVNAKTEEKPEPVTEKPNLLAWEETGEVRDVKAGELFVTEMYYDDKPVKIPNLAYADIAGQFQIVRIVESKA
jgi:hypothetical protein